MRGGRAGGLAALALAYGAALAAAWGVFGVLDGEGLLLRSAVADLAATAVVFGFSAALRNTSVYDPYWSVAPLVLVAVWARAPAEVGAEPLRVVAVLTLVGVWGIRLTWNFLRRWRGLGDEDWRYSHLRERTRGAFPLVNLLGLHLMPTVVVFAGLLPVWALLTGASEPLGPLDGLALVVTAGAITIESTADRQLRRFIDSGPAKGAFLTTGLWAWSRHPNYFGELSFWWGLWLFALAASPDHAWTVIGPAAMTVLFVAVSVPMMERRMRARRPGYEAHAARVAALVPRPPRRA